MTVRIRKRFCPNCNHKLDAVINMQDENAKPRRGDFTVCINCAEILQFGKNLRLKKLKGKELETMDQETFFGIMKIRTAVVRMKNERQL